MEKNLDTSFLYLVLTMGILIVWVVVILLLAKEVYRISISIKSCIAEVATFTQQTVNTRLEAFAVSVAAGIFLDLIKIFFVQK